MPALNHVKSCKMSINWRRKSDDGNSNRGRSISEDDSEADKDKEEGGKQVQNIMSLCKESSGMMATVTSLRSTLHTSKRSTGEDGEEEVGVSRGREWGEINPLTLQTLKEALEEQEPQLPALTHANATNTASHVTSLSLQFKGLGSLDFLWMLTNITRLVLSNNSLTDTRGLERLSKLTWLDLSFNQISRISSLKSLRNLEVLALHNNLLRRLERGALQPLSHLQVLTLANNKIHDIDDVRTLRQVKCLASLNLANNPLCDHRYPDYVLAHLPDLAYLDHRRLTPQDHAHAAQQYKYAHVQLQSVVAVVEAQEEKAQQQEEQERLTRASQEEHRRAGVLALNDGSLFSRMFRGDKDMGVLLQLPGAHTLMTKYRDQFNAVCLRVFNAGLDHEVQRQTELELLQEALDVAKNDADTYARGVVRRVEGEVETVVAAGQELRAAEEASLGDDQEAHEARVAKAVALREQFDALLDDASQDLLTAEVTLADQVKFIFVLPDLCKYYSQQFGPRDKLNTLQDVVDRAREELGTLVGNFLEAAAMELQEGRRLAYTFYCRLRELTAKMVDDGAGGSEGMDEERTARVFEGSDTLTSALAGIHDRHLALIDSREADLRQHLQQWLTHTLHEISKAEWARHRSRVEEITTLTARQRQLLYDALPTTHE
ncbi:Dynein regulatory complex subunit 3-like [Homarus americanus]|uniref:Dynein axonemal assembly factor 1 homolog n=1 Tax=Homarus americanus TaxID=6706 RepID=A0A8J5N4U7_HOMAM|nr:Dynein regulatory complex subunit 3-like [Homarus americanus]